LQPLRDVPCPATARHHSKKKSLIATEQLTPEIQALRARFIQSAAHLDAQRLVFVDEAGSNIGMTRDWARSPVGERAPGTAPRNRGTVTTILGALASDGVRAVMTIEGGTDAHVFEAFLTHFLVPNLRPGDIVVLDNLGAHKMPFVRQRIEAVGARLRYLPPYSPDLNPIELCWSKVKHYLKTFGARTREALDSAIALAIELVTDEDIAGWFSHCGYSAQLN